MKFLLFQHVTVIDGTGSAPRADMIDIVTRKECIRMVVQDGNVVVYRNR